MADSFKVGEAPWEKGNQPESFPVGQAPWEKAQPPTYGKNVLSDIKSGQFDLNKPTPEDKRSVLDLEGRALDYPGGLMRTGLASAAGLATGKPAVNENDVAAAFKGQAPKSSEYLERLGVTPGPKAGNTSLRDVEGFGLDVATDPLTLLAKAGKLNPVGEAAEGAGKTLYKSGLKNVDAKLAEEGAKPLSDILLENGAPTGTTKTLAGKAEDIGKGLLEKRQGIYDEVNAAKGAVDPTYDMARKEIERLRYVGADEAADAAQKVLDKNTARGFLPIDRASAIKTNLYQQFNPETRAMLGRFKNALGLDLKGAIEDSANKFAGEGRGADISKLNENLGSIIEAQRPLDTQIRRAEGKTAISPLDAVLAVLHPGAEIAKKAMDLGNLTYARTNLGKGLMTAGENGLAQGTFNRGLINALTPEQKDELLKQQLKLSGEK